jgi:hypothetical protein
VVGSDRRRRKQHPPYRERVRYFVCVYIHIYIYLHYIYIFIYIIYIHTHTHTHTHTPHTHTFTCIHNYIGARLQLEEEPEPHLKIQGMPESRKTAKALVRALLEREEDEFHDVPVITIVLFYVNSMIFSYGIPATSQTCLFCCRISTTVCIVFLQRRH